MFDLIVPNYTTLALSTDHLGDCSAERNKHSFSLLPASIFRPESAGCARLRALLATSVEGTHEGLRPSYLCQPRIAVSHVAWIHGFYDSTWFSSIASDALKALKGSNPQIGFWTDSRHPEPQQLIPPWSMRQRKSRCNPTTSTARETQPPESLGTTGLKLKSNWCHDFPVIVCLMVCFSIMTRLFHD